MSDNDGQILVATDSFSVRFEGADRHFVAGDTRVRAGHPILRGIEHLFKPIAVHYEVEQATAAPAEKRAGRRGKQKAEVEQATAAPAEEPDAEEPPVEETVEEQAEPEKPVE